MGALSLHMFPISLTKYWPAPFLTRQIYAPNKHLVAICNMIRKEGVLGKSPLEHNHPFVLCNPSFNSPFSFISPF